MWCIDIVRIVWFYNYTKESKDIFRIFTFRGWTKDMSLDIEYSLDRRSMGIK
jgi:hypothetical protein